MALDFFNEDLLLSKINKAVMTSRTATAGLTPISDGSGGYAWGTALTGTFSVSDEDDDGNVVFEYSEGE